VPLLGVEVRDPTHHQTAGNALGLLAGTNAVNPVSATSAREIHRPVASSKTASVYSMVVHASSAIAAIAALIWAVHPDRDRHCGAADQRRRLDRVPDQSLHAPGGVAGSLAQPLRHDHRRARGAGTTQRGGA
jgi:hypothetical protein